MDRRELIKMIALLTGGAVVGSEVFLTGCKPKDQAVKDGAPAPLTETDATFLDEVAETILPQTKTPGAKAAKVGSFMVLYVNDCYTPKEQQVFHDGIDQLDKACKKMHDHDFMSATPQQRHDLFLSLENEVKEYQKKRADWEKDQDIKEKEHIDRGGPKYEREPFPQHYYTLMKQLTLFGFFTSKEGMMEAQNYTPVPGKWEACIEYKKGDKRYVGLDG